MKTNCLSLLIGVTISRTTKYYGTMCLEPPTLKNNPSK